MQIVESILVNNPCYKAGRKIVVKGLMLHSVGCNQPNAKVFINGWNRSDYNRSCVHGFIDGTGVIYKTLPWNHRGWHGGGSSNNTHIGVEMCEPAEITYTYGATFKVKDLEKARKIATNTYNAAVELFAFLCEEYDLDPLKKGVIVSHKEGCALGIASNHGDPEHLWSGLGMPYTMDTFRKAVYDKIQENKGVENTMTQEELKKFIDAEVEAELKAFTEVILTNMGRGEEASSWAKDRVEKAKESGITDGSNPKAFATRQEVMIMCYNTMQKLNEKDKNV